MNDMTIKTAILTTNNDNLNNDKKNLQNVLDQTKEL